jgi:hypothetical protein
MVAAAALLAGFATTGADLLVRCKSSRRLPVRARDRDGPILSQLGPLTVRAVDAQISIVTPTGPCLEQPGTIPQRAAGSDVPDMSEADQLSALAGSPRQEVEPVVSKGTIGVAVP